jgi:hypothetical protein
MQITISGRAAALLVVTAAIIVGGSIAYAAIPDSSGVFTGCRSNSNGSLRLIDKTVATSSPLGRCTAAETEVQWGQTGPQGLVGATGPQGPQGNPGPAATLDNLNVFWTSQGFRDLDSRESATIFAFCPSGSRRVAGGFSSRDVTVHSSLPFESANGDQGWQVSGTADFALISSDAFLRPWVVCVTLN